MRHDLIRHAHPPAQPVVEVRMHSMDCRCLRCMPAHQRPIVEPEDIEAMRRGLIGGVGVGSVLLLMHYWPVLAGWFAS